jgi:hypothetical protein
VGDELRYHPDSCGKNPLPTNLWEIFPQRLGTFKMRRKVTPDLITEILTSITSSVVLHFQTHPKTVKDLVPTPESKHQDIAPLLHRPRAYDRGEAERS